MRMPGPCLELRMTFLMGVTAAKGQYIVENNIVETLTWLRTQMLWPISVSFIPDIPCGLLHGRQKVANILDNIFNREMHLL